MMKSILTGFLASTILSGCNVHQAVPLHKTTLFAPDSVALAEPQTAMEFIEASVGETVIPFRANGKAQLSYELLIANYSSQALSLKTIDLINPAKPNQPLASFSEPYLSKHFLRHGLRPIAGDRLLKGNGFGVANLWAEIDEKQLPQSAHHRLVFELTTQQGLVRELVIEAGRMNVSSITLREIRPPFEPGTWFYTTEGHRNTRMLNEGRPSYAQRFATDWAALQPDGTFVSGDRSHNENYPTYGKALLAVADGTVVSTSDGLGDNNPETGETAVQITQGRITGNHIMIDIGYANAVYAHLKSGSLRVKVGDTVKAGDVIGFIGNSGNSDGPHLHFHLETKTGLRKPLAGSGIPYHFKRFEQVASYNNEQMAAAFEGTRLPLNAQADLRKNEYPLEHGVIIFSK